MKLPIGSYTFNNTFENCPHKAFHTYVARTIPYEETPEMAWGNKVHRAMELRIRYGAPLPDEMKAAEKAAAQFHEMSKKLPVHCEYQVAMTVDGKPCDYADYDKVWLRGKIDCAVMDPKGTNAWIVDWKTGNVREDPFELQTFGLLLKANYPTLEQIQAEYFWMKPGQNGLRYTFTTHVQVYERIAKLKQEAETYLRAGEWPKRKNPLCGWCKVTSCEYNKLGKKNG